MKLDANGNSLWKKIYGTVDADQGNSVEQLSDGGYLIAGMSAHGGSYDMYIVRTNAGGDSLWTTTIGGSSDDRAFSTASSPAGDYFVTGWAWSYGQGLGDVYLIKLVDFTLEVGDNSELPASPTLQQNYPNPFNPLTTIQFHISKTSFTTLRVYDLLGHEVATLTNGQLTPGTYQVTFDASHLASGVYYYRLQTGLFSDMKKLVLLK
jgi:hypothetical protein